MRPTGRLCDELLRWIVLEIQIMREEYDRPNNAPSTIHPPSQNPFKTKTSTCWSPRIISVLFFLSLCKSQKPSPAHCDGTNGVPKLIGAEEACWAHNPKVRGSKPRSANLFGCIWVRFIIFTTILLLFNLLLMLLLHIMVLIYIHTCLAYAYISLSKSYRGRLVVRFGVIVERTWRTIDLSPSFSKDKSATLVRQC